MQITYVDALVMASELAPSSDIKKQLDQLIEDYSHRCTANEEDELVLCGRLVDVQST
jgi:hypothetical protein